ncbi:helix-turn-helix domain-containing protein [Mycolicibacterium chlorophenolicum]|uniref:Helix-turn-helix domain protein n=1 Tax=Mycolicibacterium chlorophenolicum TaxID=37916 RepID=A0A0J6WM54_9MYCO|nr:helix-turn-helix transcriptional regulator [Mycolicibacterium chlorophenolicum]KMO83674.1 Helix-turn-helix domain protein [Mycolicibacterium chlorophenolicum]
MHDDAEDVGVARAGAAFAARREELGISQRELARLKIIGAPRLINFEKGRAWPREKTRAKLEAVVKWPPGTLAKLRNEREAPRSAANGQFRDETASLLSGAVKVAADQVLASVEQLPATDDPAFPQRARVVLADLRTLEGITARAVRGSQGSAEMIKLLREVRHRYDGLMARAAAAPSATLGQRLYTVRNAAALSVAEAAGALDVASEVVVAVETEQPVSEEDRRRIEKLIEELSG